MGMGCPWRDISGVSPACALPALSSSLSQPFQRAFCAAGVFPPPPPPSLLLIPNQEIKGRQRLRLFPTLRRSGKFQERGTVSFKMHW